MTRDERMPKWRAQEKCEENVERAGTHMLPQLRVRVPTTSRTELL